MVEGREAPWPMGVAGCCNASCAWQPHPVGRIAMPGE